jgi:hypothetical protein
MFFKTRKPITEVEKLDAILEYLNAEMTRWQNSKTLAGHLVTKEYINKVDHRIMYLEEQIVLTSAKRALENINPQK